MAEFRETLFMTPMSIPAWAVFGYLDEDNGYVIKAVKPVQFWVNARTPGGDVELCGIVIGFEGYLEFPEEIRWHEGQQLISLIYYTNEPTEEPEA